MNGRVYDYNLGRFLSVDPFIHGGSQGINPYSYILNNPLAGTDPSGYSPECHGLDSSACGPKEPPREKKDRRRGKGGGWVTVYYNGATGIAGSSKKTSSSASSDSTQIESQASRASSTSAENGVDADWVGDGITQVGEDKYQGTVNCDAICISEAHARVGGGAARYSTLGLLSIALYDGPQPGPMDVAAVIAASVGWILLSEETSSSGDNFTNMRGASESSTGGPGQEPDDDKYENPGHHDPSGRGPNPYINNRSVLPKNHQELWKASRKGSDGNRWTKVGNGKKAVYHRFQNDGNGNWHWNGSTNGVTKAGKPRAIRMNHVPKDVRRW